MFSWTFPWYRYKLRDLLTVYETWIKSMIQQYVPLTSCIVSGNSEANMVQDKIDISSYLLTKKLEINILVYIQFFRSVTYMCQIL